MLSVSCEARSAKSSNAAWRVAGVEHTALRCSSSISTSGWTPQMPDPPPAPKLPPPCAVASPSPATMVTSSSSLSPSSSLLFSSSATLPPPPPNPPECLRRPPPPACVYPLPSPAPASPPLTTGAGIPASRSTSACGRSTGTASGNKHLNMSTLTKPSPAALHPTELRSRRSTRHLISASRDSRCALSSSVAGGATRSASTSRARSSSATASLTSHTPPLPPLSTWHSSVKNSRHCVGCRSATARASSSACIMPAGTEAGGFECVTAASPSGGPPSIRRSSAKMVLARRNCSGERITMSRNMAGNSGCSSSSSAGCRVGAPPVSPGCTARCRHVTSSPAASSAKYMSSRVTRSRPSAPEVAAATALAPGAEASALSPS
mmetsp:Transcript_12308/g.29802  ORF Transcript_12308/g.29802 Transcript_12308/m.29802 type:complete len:378 (-) Transcript_12308:204-1337(-)